MTILLVSWLILPDRLAAAVRSALEAYGGAAAIELNELYAPAAYAPLWVENSGRLARGAEDALELLRTSAGDGLDPADYRLALLERLSLRLQTGKPPSLPELATFDVALSAGTIRYLHHLHAGRVDPQSVGFRVAAPADDLGVPAMLRTAIADHQVIELAARQRPPFAQYEALRRSLSRYRLLALLPDAARGELPSTGTVLHPGESSFATSALGQRLAAVGDLPAGLSSSAGTNNEGPFVDGVKRFQVRHGLTADGVIGTQTQAALRVPFGRRVRQIELALERLRWLPRLGPQRLIGINIPMFRLWAWERGSSGNDVAVGMNVIVGRAMRTRTPVFVEQLREVVFRPDWNVPSSIARQEIVPILEHDPDYLRREDIEIVGGPESAAPAVALSAASLARLRQGTLRLRQRPGPRNALGLIKFVFPNSESIYMHGTPSPVLFSRSRRDFSHGCVRVEDPVALSEWVLAESGLVTASGR